MNENEDNPMIKHEAENTTTGTIGESIQLDEDMNENEDNPMIKHEAENTTY